MVSVANRYVYDHMGRKTQTFEKINTGTNILLSQNDYNPIGQVMAKHLHGANSGVSFLQDISYQYNERGWLKRINDPAIAPTATRLFSEQLGYDSVKTTTTPKNYNGNITEQLFQNYSPTPYPGQQNVIYTYDPMNRLNSGISSTTLSETGISYDEIGNIISLTRNGNTGNYAYTDNQLSTISGVTTSTYAYDGNGNVSHDGRTGATVNYNLLNLPQTVTATTPTSINITYTYDANGQKLRKVSNGSSTDYISGIQYKPDAATIDFIQTEEGRAINSGGNYTYEYTLTDHLGNNRVTFDQTNGKVGEEDYYPFGLNVDRKLNAGNKYLYNKKELQDELGQYDYGARFYDPVVARWSVIDSYAEKSRRWSPYNYGENNPIKNVDLGGDSIKVASRTQFNSFFGSNATTIDISVTGKVENDSSSPYSDSQMQNIAQRISGAISNYYSTAGTDSDGPVISNASANITATSSLNPVVPGDDVFRIVDPGKVPSGLNDNKFAPENTMGMSKYGENVAYVSNAAVAGTPATIGQFENTGKTNNGGATLERTASHELGHLGGLDDIKPGLIRGNLMRQTGGKDAGTNVVPAQLKEILKNYKEGRLNDGRQSFN